MNLRYILFICVCCCYFSMSAQDVTKTGVIILNDGSTIKGELLPESTPEIIKIKLTSGAQIAIPNSSIKEIKKSKENFRYFDNGSARRKEGYFGFVKAGILVAHTYYSFALAESATLQTVHGYRFNKNLAAGIGASAESYDGTTFIPIYAHLRYEPFDIRVRPYISGDVGYGIPINENGWESYDGGLMLHPAIGIQFSSRYGGGMFLEAGLKMQWAQYTGQWWWDDVEYVDKWRYNRMSVTFGYQF